MQLQFEAAGALDAHINAFSGIGETDLRGVIISIKDDAIIIRVAPDNLKLEVAKSAIASVTTQDEPSAS